MVRDEADIIESTVRHMATQVDWLIVADNRSQDGTREILESLAGDLPLTVVDEPQPGYYQSQIVSGLARQAAERGAEWVVPFDADEWHFSTLGRLADVLADTPEEIAVARTYDHIPTGEDDPGESDPLRRIGWRERDPFAFPKVACRVSPDLTIQLGSHFADYGDRKAEFVVGRFEIRHFQYRSPAQFARKIENGLEALEATALVSPICFHWRQYAPVLREGGSEALEETFFEHHYRRDPRAEIVVDGELRPPLVFDPVGGGR